LRKLEERWADAEARLNLVPGCSISSYKASRQIVERVFPRLPIINHISTSIRICRLMATDSTSLSLRLHIRQMSGREWPSKYLRLMLLLVADDSFNQRRRIVNANVSAGERSHWLSPGATVASIRLNSSRHFCTVSSDQGGWLRFSRRRGEYERTTTHRVDR
jgi:hypothetical protein